MVMHRYHLIVSAEHMAVFCRWQHVLEFWVLWWQVFLWHMCLAGMDHISYYCFLFIIVRVKKRESTKVLWILYFALVGS